MPLTKDTIHITLVYGDKEYRVKTTKGNYRSLMSLISDYLAMPGFGICCGMGSCGTCRVEICENGWLYKNSVLSCSIPVNDGLANSKILVPNIFES